ncbi:PadR family transcriptional regulator [Lacticaseibacillus zhaodongensis]|uniref:PadR family transcriptional regulator n=1 Tax=Lacticaseibacillus zhaodongensis TaxID=2668065 RepID=UPI0012D3358E|nr:PadR family transcriptional regulator [Lacticaseibacillus zhaodongensis]
MDSQLKKGLVEYSVLATLRHGDSYGYQIIKDSPALLGLTQSTLYPILKRLETDGRVSTYSQTHNGRERKYYHVTEQGKQSITQFLADWEQLETIHAYIQRSEQNEEE